MGKLRNNVIGSKLCICMIKVATIFYTLGILSSITVYATSNVVKVEGQIYEFDGEKSEYPITEMSPSNNTDANNTYGTFELSGALSATEDSNGYNSYVVNTGNIKFSYHINPDAVKSGHDGWSLTNDNKKSIDGIKLDDKINSGALILQSSKDGNN